MDSERVRRSSESDVRRHDPYGETVPATGLPAGASGAQAEIGCAGTAVFSDGSERGAGLSNSPRPKRLGNGAWLEINTLDRSVSPLFSQFS